MMSNLSRGTTEVEESFATHTVTLLAILIGIVTFLAVIGNTLTIISFIKDAQLRVVYNVYIVNLAICDLLIGIVSMAFYSVYTLETFTWLFGDMFCKIWLCMDFTSNVETVFMMIILSWDRALLLAKGPSYSSSETKRIAMVKISISWVLAFVLYSPAIIGYDIWTGTDNIGEGECNVQFHSDFLFTLVTATLDFVIPLTCLCALNAYIFIKIRSRLRQHNKRQTRNTDHLSTTATTSQFNGETATSKGENSVSKNQSSPKYTELTLVPISVRREAKAAKSLALLVTVFFVLWGPYTIATIIASACGECIHQDIYEFLIWLLWSKAALNPFLYAYNSERFRNNYVKLLPCLKNKTNTITPSVVKTSSQNI